MIKECPFCGSKPVFYGIHADGRTKVFNLTHKDDCYLHNCVTFYSDSEQEKRWNTRSIQQERMEKLNKINK